MLPLGGIIQFSNFVENWFMYSKKCYFHVKMLNYGENNSMILTKHQYMTLLAIIFIPQNFLIFQIFAIPHGGSRIRSLFNFKYLTKNDYFDHPNCLWWVIRHHIIVLHRFHDIDILLGRFGGDEQILLPHAFPTTKKSM